MTAQKSRVAITKAKGQVVCQARLVDRKGFEKFVEVPYPPPRYWEIAFINKPIWPASKPIKEITNFPPEEGSFSTLVFELWDQSPMPPVYKEQGFT